MQQIEQYYARGTIGELVAKRGTARLLNSLTEITQFIDIHQGLRTQQATPELRRRLAKFAAGTSMLSSEIASTTVARNFGFELEIAAHAATAGLQVRLDETGDIFLLVGSRAVAIECKRLFSRKKVEARITKGRRQLQRIYDNDQDATGILAIGVSKLINDGSKILRGNTQLDVQKTHRPRT